MKQLLLFIFMVTATVAICQHNSFIVNGTVTDNDGSPVPFAAIKIKSTKLGTMADANGQFSIRAKKDDVLVCTATGFTTVEVAVKSQTFIAVRLLKEQPALTEVVVTSSLGLVRKSKNTITESHSVFPRAFNTLQGQVAGAQLNTASGYSTDNAALQPAKIAPGAINPGELENEAYAPITENTFRSVIANPVSTFSIDVDAASYSNIRRFIKKNRLPPADAVRIEEMINYFTYDYPQPSGDDPFSITTEVASAPWNDQHSLVLIGLLGKKIPEQNLPPSNLVFLIDVSGSMMRENKLPLVKYSMKLLADQLRPQDKVAMVVYAGAAGLVLPSTSGKEKLKIKNAIDALEAGGSTAGGAGIQLAYQTAVNNFIKGGNNRVILCTDGDFNVGESSNDAMERLIEEKRKTGVYLTVLGYGTGNYKEDKMQQLATKGNGNHAYIDGPAEAKKVLLNEFGSTVYTIAKDVKLQVEFNPAVIQGYRLIGYENRILNQEDFNDDTKDAGEMGSGHTVTALYEIIPVGAKSEFIRSIDTLKYQDNTPLLGTGDFTNELMTVKFRYKAVDADSSKLLEKIISNQSQAYKKASANFRFAAAVAQFGMLLRNSPFKSASSYINVLELAHSAREKDTEGYRSEFISLVKAARDLADSSDNSEE